MTTKNPKAEKRGDYTVIVWNAKRLFVRRVTGDHEAAVVSDVARQLMLGDEDDGGQWQIADGHLTIDSDARDDE